MPGCRLVFDSPIESKETGYLLLLHRAAGRRSGGSKGRLEMSMSGTAFKKMGSTFSPRSPVEVMDSNRSTATHETGADLLQSLVQGARGRAMRAQLASRYPDCSSDEIEEAIQYACKSFLDDADGITAPGQ